MMTKREACLAKIEEYCKKNEIRPGDLVDKDVYYSSSLGIAMEYLGMIKTNEAKEYIANRGGHFMMWWDPDSESAKSISFREFIKLLPEK